MISLSLCFSSGPPKMTSMPFLAKARICGSDSPKCSATSLYSFDSGLPNTPTSSVYIFLVSVPLTFARCMGTERQASHSHIAPPCTRRPSL